MQWPNCSIPMKDRKVIDERIKTLSSGSHDYSIAIKALEKRLGNLESTLVDYRKKLDALFSTKADEKEIAKRIRRNKEK